MARKPNYQYERNARARAKAEKREAKRQAKLAARAQKAADTPEGEASEVEPGAEADTEQAPERAPD